MVTTKAPGSEAVQHWRELYLAALFETDRKKILSRIAEAERALLVRARELHAISQLSSEEGKALDKGLYALRALRDCFPRHELRGTNTSC